MKSFLSIFLIILFSFFSFVIFMILVSVSDWADYTVASSLPHYTNALSWNVFASSGFPDGRPGATVEAYVPFNSPYNNYNFVNEYTKQLLNNDWKFDKDIPDPGDSITITGGTLDRMIYKKNFGIVTYSVDIYKYQYGERYQKEYPNTSGRERVLIFVSRKTPYE